MPSVVISYSSIEAPFIRAGIREALKFSDDIIIVASDHLFSGQPEDHSFLKDIAQEFLGIRVFIQTWSADKPPRYWHNAARWQGAQLARHERVLFLDADEIVEGNKMREFLLRPLPFDVYAFMCYWYFREPIYRASEISRCGLLVKRTAISKELIFSDDERWAFRKHPDLQAEESIGLRGLPFVHHYSWVRTREQMLRKVASWAHSDAKDWAALIQNEFSHPFSGTDFVHGFSYATVPNEFGIELEDAAATD